VEFVDLVRAGLIEPTMQGVDVELGFLLIICGLLVVPKALQRARIPAPLTCLIIGIVVVHFGSVRDGGAIQFAAVLGITSLFLFAGLEVNFAQLRRRATAMLGYAGLRLASLVVLAVIAGYLLDTIWQASVLLALALLTSSTGFILDSLDRFTLTEHERDTIGGEAIVGELLALVILFVVMQSTDTLRLTEATGALIGLIVAVPLVYFALARWVLPHAPGSELSLLVTVAIAAAFFTNRLGVEHLLGAFAAGVIASQMPTRGSLLQSPEAMHAVKLFSTFFMPFYFFRSGLHVPAAAFSAEALGWGLLMCTLIPLRVGAAFLRRKWSGDEARSANRVSVSLLPTLIFTVVLGQILVRDFGLDDALLGGLLFYAFVNTLLPSLLLRVGLESGWRYEQPAAVKASTQADPVA
jgi:Kef-type K+ transport system membrane component KefB